MLLDENVVQNALTWEGYYGLCDRLVAEKKSTWPDPDDLEHAHFTELNLHRMKRVFKTLRIAEDVLAKFSESPRQLWILITESWCGDAAQLVPVIARLAGVSPTIQLRILLRDEHPELMDLFLVNGSRSIPKLICVDPDSFEVRWDWGPRPAGAREVVKNVKLQGGDKEQISLALQEWYNTDRGQSTLSELAEQM
jgi:hypothetical protein